MSVLVSGVGSSYFTMGTVDNTTACCALLWCFYSCVVATLLRWQIVTGTRLYKLEALWLGSLTFLKKIEASRKQIKSAHSYCTITYINKIRIKRSFLCMGLPSNTTIDNLPSEAEIDTGLRGSPFLSQLGRDIPSLLRRQNITGTVFEIEKFGLI